MFFCECSINRVGGWVTCTVKLVSADTGILWNGACLSLICAHRDINILSVISVYLLKNISYFKNLYVFESWWIQTPSLCVFVYKSSDKIHISLFLQTLKLCDNILSEMRNFHQIITKLLVIYFANNLKDVWTSIVKIVCALKGNSMLKYFWLFTWGSQNATVFCYETVLPS